MMRLSLHVYETRRESEIEINRIIDLWEHIFNNEDIEMLLFEEKYKIYSWYPSLFEKLEISETNFIDRHKKINEIIDWINSRGEKVEKNNNCE